MRLRRTPILGLGPLMACAAMGSAQTPTQQPTCTWPPPLVCPPPPPNGPQTVAQVDNLIRDIDVTIGAYASVERDSNWSASSEAKEKLNEYVGELKDYRDAVAEYRDKIDPEIGTMVASPDVNASDPE